MGLFPGDFPTVWYDQKMERVAVAELQSQVNTKFSDIRRDNYASICFVLGRTYLKAFEGVQNLAPTHTEPIVIYGPMGKKQTQLKKWLWQKDPHTLAERNLNEGGSY